MSGAVAQAAAVRENAGLFVRDDRGRIDVSGADRVRWLNGMISNDVAALVPGPESSGCYALLLTPKGRIVADLHVFTRDDALWLDVPADACDEVRTRLDARIIADDVTLEIATSDWAVLDLVGPRAFEWLSRIATVPTLGVGACAPLEVAGRAAWVARVGLDGDGARLMIPVSGAARVRAALAGEAQGAVVDGTPETYEILRIESGMPRLGADFGEDAFPEEAGLVPRAVSLTKGCYTGQEIVARIESRAQLKRKLVTLRFEGAVPESGAALLRDGESLGVVTSAADTPSGARGLGYVRKPHDEAGARFATGDGSATVVAQVA